MEDTFSENIRFWTTDMLLATSAMLLDHLFLMDMAEKTTKGLPFNGRLDYDGIDRQIRSQLKAIMARLGHQPIKSSLTVTSSEPWRDPRVLVTYPDYLDSLGDSYLALGGRIQGVLGPNVDVGRTLTQK